MNINAHIATHRNSFRKINGLAAIVLSGAVAVTAMPAHAGWFDTARDTASNAVSSARSTVSAPSRPTPIRDKTEELIQRAEETQSTVNAMIAEADVIKRKLDPLTEAFDTVREMKDRFQSMGFNPAELLQAPEVQDAVDMLKDRREQMRQRLNDPHLEEFRGEMLGTLADLRVLVAADIGLADRERSPVETLVENAPRTVLALIKGAAETGFGQLQEGTRQLADDVAELRRANVLGELASEADFCRAHRIGSETVYFQALRAKKRLVAVTTALELIANRIPSTPMRFGVHGYAELVQIDMGNSTKTKIGTILIALKGLGSRLDLVRETASHYSTPGACGN